MRSILRIDPDYLDNGRTAQFRQPGGLLTARRLGPPYADFVRTRLLAERVDPNVSARVLDPVADSIYVAAPAGGLRARELSEGSCS